MNEPKQKKILFNKSTLLSLKAELLKKQEEVLDKKQQSQHKLENFRPAPSKGADKYENTNKILKKSFKDSLQARDIEELDACRKSKLALEKKAALYEHLSDKSGISHLASNFLVDFDAKKREEIPLVNNSSPVKYDHYESDKEDEGEWTEFTDCLGRTRKCLNSDLELYLEKDKVLMKAICKDHVHCDGDKEEHAGETKPEKPFLVQMTNNFLKLQREKWEKQEQELLAKDKDIHYQDLLFDEARMHGVGYYAFSTDETERQKQMEELKRVHEETVQAQREAEEKRKKRDEMLATRVAAARARRRIRAGLPPEDPEETKKEFTTRLLELLTQQKEEADAKAKEEERKLKEEQEEERRKLREVYVREWDLGKEGVENKVKKFSEMSQEEYVEQQRAKRIEEFAPPQTALKQSNNNVFDDKGASSSQPKCAIQKTWKDVRPKTSSPPTISFYEEPSRKGLYFSTENQNKQNMKYKNFIKEHETVPIVNELSDEEIQESEQHKNKKRKSQDSFTEIAPPPTYDYYGPTPKHPRPQKLFDSDVSEAYAQGVQSLQQKSRGKQLPQHYDFTFD